jgi:RNA polymerase sigma-70 factor (ECF subfamily)
MEALNISHINDNYGKQLRAVAYDIVKDYDLAKDVFQNSLVKMWKNQHKFDESKGALFTWMRSIVVRSSIDSLRTKQKDQRFLASPEEAVFSKGVANINIDTIDLRENLNKLEFKYSFIIKELYLTGLTQAQIAKQYGIPLGTVKSRTKVGMRELRKIYLND